MGTRGLPSAYGCRAQEEAQEERIRWRRRGRAGGRILYFEPLVSEHDASTADRYLLGRIGRGEGEKGRTGTWLVVSTKRRWIKSCEQLPYAVTKKSPFRSGRLLLLSDLFFFLPLHLLYAFFCRSHCSRWRSCLRPRHPTRHKVAISRRPRAQINEGNCFSSRIPLLRNFRNSSTMPGNGADPEERSGVRRLWASRVVRRSFLQQEAGVWSTFRGKWPAVFESSAVSHRNALRTISADYLRLLLCLTTAASVLTVLG